MRSKPTCPRTCAARRSQAGFTLAEVLAALLFMAIVIPVTIEGLRIAGLAGQVGQCRGVATRLADQVLNEWIVTGQYTAPVQSGTIEEDGRIYRWTTNLQSWPEGTLQLASARVVFTLQGQEYEARVCTLLPISGQ